MTESATEFDRQCLEALKTLGKTLGQMALYKPGHPAVAETLRAAREHLSGAMAGTGTGELVLSLDHDKWIGNGRIVGAAGQVPGALTSAMNRFKLNSITFSDGLTLEELVSFCELSALRPEDAKKTDVKDFFAKRGVTHIQLNEAVYTKLDEKPETTAPAPKAAPEGALSEVLRDKTLEDSLRMLIERAIPDPVERAKVFELVMRQLREDLERRVADATHSLRKEKNVLHNEAVRTQTVLQNMFEGVVVVDEQGKILMMNPAAEEMVGLTLAQAAGSPLAEKAGEGAVVTMAAEISTPEDRPVQGGVNVRGGEDTLRTIKSASTLVQNEAGKVVGMVSSLTDMAKQKQLQRMEREFVAHVTHELRAPLASIRAALDILQEEFQGRLQESEGRILNAAVTNSDRLEKLINSILDFSKLEAGQMTVHPKPVDSELILREAQAGMSPWAQKKGLSLTMRLEPGLIPVMADHSRTVQVMVNLISNAVKFTPVGGKVVLAAGPWPDDPTNFALFAVSDTGPGIPKDQFKKIFEKFIQISSGETASPGTGLGLSIAKSLVNLQGGRIWLESEAGKGTIFYFTLPVAAGSKPETGPVESPLSRRPWWKKLLGLR